MIKKADNQTLYNPKLGPKEARIGLGSVTSRAPIFRSMYFYIFPSKSRSIRVWASTVSETIVIN
jgi:hypothetical protein